MIDDLGTRMKDSYEIRTRTFLPRRTYTIIRLDGVAFHTFTRGLKRPFDEDLINDMNETARFLCEKIQGAKYAFVQSDEISILLTDFERHETSAWFDGEVQKIVSVSAAMATAKFNQLRLKRKLMSDDIKVEECISEKDINTIFAKSSLAFFDSRVYTIPDPIEVSNYFIWRQKDCMRNSVSMAAQSEFSHKELEGKSSTDKITMLLVKGVDWPNYPARFRHGGFVTKIQREFYRSVTFGMVPLEDVEVEGEIDKSKIIKRNNWECIASPVFLEDRNFLYNRIPVIASEVMSLSEMIQRTENDVTVEDADGINHLS